MCIERATADIKVAECSFDTECCKNLMEVRFHSVNAEAVTDSKDLYLLCSGKRAFIYFFAKFALEFTVAFCQNAGSSAFKHFPIVCASFCFCGSSSSCCSFFCCCGGFCCCICAFCCFCGYSTLPQAVNNIRKAKMRANKLVTFFICKKSFQIN